MMVDLNEREITLIRVALILRMDRMFERGDTGNPSYGESRDLCNKLHEERKKDRVSLVEALTEIKTNRDADADRFRWLLNGHGYFMEENYLCGNRDTSTEEEQQVARRIIDEAMKQET